MELLEEDIAILEHDLEVLSTVMGALARTVDHRLFDTDPSLRLLFQLPVSGSGERVAGALQMLVRSLRRPSVVAPEIAHLGSRYATRGVRERDYRAFAAVIIGSIADVLDGELTDSSRVAWAALADQVCSMMIGGARDSFAAAVAF